MQQKRSIRELVFSSAKELLERTSIEKITVRDIAENCGISTRSFYNNFTDKNSVVSRLYLTWMQPYLLCSLREWNDQRARLFMAERSFFANTLCYQGQNSILETIVWLDREKYLLHVRPEIVHSPSRFQLVTLGITYMIYGNFGVLQESYRCNFIPPTQDYGRYYQESWEMMSSWMPKVVSESLEQTPVRLPAKTVLERLAPMED